jgi:hypothetical protein
VSSHVNYNRVFTVAGDQTEVVANLVTSINAFSAGYVVTTDWRSWVLIKQRESNKQQWIIAALLLLFFRFIFFWTQEREYSLALDFDRLSAASTRVRVTGVSSPDMASHVETLLRASAHRLAVSADLHSTFVASPLGHAVLKAPVGLPAADALHDGDDEAPDSPGRVRAACVRCQCQDFVAGAEHDKCAVCGHDGSTAHSMLCPPAMPDEPTEWAACALGPGKLLVAGGQQGGLSISSTWSFQPPAGWTPEAELPEPRFSGKLLPTSESSAMLIGSRNASHEPDGKTFVWSGREGWSDGPNLPIPIAEVAAVRVADGAVIVAGGRDREGHPCASTFVLAGGIWSELAPLPEPLWGTSLVVSPDANLLAVGGMSASGEVTSVWTFDAHTGSWVAHSRMPIPVREAVCEFVEAEGHPVLCVSGGINTADQIGETTSMVFAPPPVSKWIHVDPSYGRMRAARYRRRPVQIGRTIYMVR